MKKFEIYLKKIFLKVLILLSRSGGSEAKAEINSTSRVLAIRLNRIGDALVSTPVIHTLKAETGCTIHLLADRKNQFVFSGSPDVDKVIVFPKGIGGLIKTVKEINRSGYDILLDLHDDVSTTVTYIAALSKVPVKAALNKENAEVYTHTIEKPDAAKTHVVDRLLKLTRIFDIESGSENIHYNLAADSIEKAEEVINSCNSDKVTGINISAGSEARYWGTDRYRSLLEKLHSYDTGLLILCAPDDREKAEAISEGKYKIFSSTDFNKFAAVISKLDFLITPDTMAVHLASAYNVPLFGIYVKYNTTDMIWSSYKSDFKCVITEEATLDNLMFDEVWNKLKPFYEKYFN